MTSERTRVVVTGLGVTSAIGVDEETVWGNLRAGRGGIGRIGAFDPTGNKVEIAAEVDSEALHAKLSKLGKRPTDRALDLAMVAGADALEQAGLLTEPPYEEQDVAVIFGSGVGSAQSHYEAFNAFAKKGPRGTRPSSVPKMMYNAISSGLSIHFRLTGTNFVVVSACTSATNAIGHAFRLVRDGYVEAALCGGADGFLDPFYYGVWNNLGVLSVNPNPEQACRPFDADRDGCVLGEGAGALVIESLERAQARGATVRGEILGYGESSDAAHRTQPSSEGQAVAMRNALEDARVEAADLGFVNSHGTGTLANDVTESRSIRLVLGDAADRVPVVANKSYFGHTLGASGALETIAALLSLEAGMLTPNLNLENPDPECQVLLAGKEPQKVGSPLAMKNSFGFGGGNGVLVLRGAE